MIDEALEKMLKYGARYQKNKTTKPPLHSMLNEATFCRLIIIPPSLELPPTFQPLRPRHSSLLRNKKQAIEVTIFRPIFAVNVRSVALERKAIRYNRRQRESS